MLSDIHWLLVLSKRGNVSAENLSCCLLKSGYCARVAAVLCRAVCAALKNFVIYCTIVGQNPKSDRAHCSLNAG
jgi:hypothetical protein